MKKYFEYDSFYAIENGEYAFYHNDTGAPVLGFRCKQVAVAYNKETLEYYRMGQPHEVSLWMTAFRAQLLESGRALTADAAIVVELPRGHDAFELTLLANDPHHYLRTFLQKAKLI